MGSKGNKRAWDAFSSDWMKECFKGGVHYDHVCKVERACSYFQKNSLEGMRGQQRVDLILRASNKFNVDFGLLYKIINRV